MIEKSTRYPFVFFLFLCLYAGSDAYAGREQYRVSCRGDSVLCRKSIYTCDQYCSLQSNFSIRESFVNVHFRYEDVLRTSLHGAIRWKLTYQITLFSPSGDSTVRTGQTIEVGYSDTGRYTDKAVNNYNNCLKARLKVIQLEVTTVQDGTSHTNTYTPGGNFSPPGDLILEVEVDMERYYRFNPSPPVVYIPNLPMSIYRGCVEAEVLPQTTLPLSWDYVQGAESYELEWLFIDCPDTLQSTANSALEFDFRNATSVSTTAQHYAIPMAYPHGLLLYRVRSIGVDISGNYARMEGNWSIPLSRGEVREAPQQYVFRYCGLEPSKNWQYTAIYAEEGKRKETIAYFDGTLRQRQEVTLLNTGKTAVVSETVYDFQGRPAVQVLPAPTLSGGLIFYSHAGGMFNGTFSRQNFDTGNKISNPDALTTGGAALYYSSSNPFMNITGNHYDEFSRYTPDAQGFAYTRTRYLDDGTDRVKSQSMPGPALKTGSGHEVKSYYGTPGSQQELDRLFGNEAGFVSHYTKNVMVDQNGQSSIAYIDGEGRIIASCLAGSTPTNLISLDKKPSPVTITANLLDNNLITADGKLSSTHTLLPVANTRYDFHYSPGSASYCHPFCIPCTDCSYRLNIILFDEESNHVIWKKQNLLISTGQSFDTSIFLSPGSYTLVKTLEPDNGHANMLAETYRNHSPPCFDTLVEPAPCTFTCEDMCANSYPLYDSSGMQFFSYFNGTRRIISQDLILRASLISECILQSCPLTPAFDACGLKKKLLLMDMSPGGQYFDNRYILNTITGERNHNVNNDWLTSSIEDNLFNENFRDSLNLIDLYAVDRNSAWNYIRSHWDENYGEVLLKFHPEYCTYFFQCEYVPQENCKVYDTILLHPFPSVYDFREYDSLMQVTTTETLASVFNLFNPLGQEMSILHTGPFGNNSSYVPYPKPDLNRCLAGSNSCLFTMGDPFFRHCNTSMSPLMTYPGFDNSFNPVVRMRDYLSNFVSSGNIVYSIWYVLSDPDNIASGSYTTLDTNITNLFEYLHRVMFKPAALGGMGMNKFMFFKGAYTFFKKKIMADIYDHMISMNANGVICSRGDYLPSRQTAMGYITTDNKYSVHFVRDTLLGLYGAGTTAMNNFISSQLSARCDTNCHSYADYWLDQLDCNGNTIDTAAIREYFLQICLHGCDFAHPQGNDTVTANNPVQLGGSNTWFSHFTDVVHYFADGMNCSVPVHPPAISPSDTSLLHPYGNAQAYRDSAMAHCLRLHEEIAEMQRMQILENRYQDSVLAVIAGYRTQCIRNIIGREIFSMVYELNEYAYTLYYYDRAGNLLKTVPPAGVHVIRGTDSLNNISMYRLAYGYDFSQPGYVLPRHKKISISRYNSLEKPISQRTPDAGLTEIWYDRMGRIALSQDSRQKPAHHFTYNIYDAEGRVMETGQVKDALSSGPQEDYLLDSTEQAAVNNIIGNAVKEQVVHTYYDTVYYVMRTHNGASVKVHISAFGQENLRSRISSITYYNTLSGDLSKYHSALHYDYDMHGNVRTFIQDVPVLSDFGRRYLVTRYNYDLISGKVNMAAFQTGQSEQFYQRYDYDADNRIIAVHSSRDGLLWDTDAKYFYYKHGPLARTELGTKQVQGLDFAYTLQGWLKRININDTTGDLGYDGDISLAGNPNASFAKDAYKFMLAYYVNDYKAVKQQGVYYPSLASYISLYNGNIAETYGRQDLPMTDNSGTFIRNFLPWAAYSHRYDQLNRLKITTAVVKNINITNFMTLSYDMDGNINTLSRKGYHNNQWIYMDNLTYKYTAVKNRLRQVTDGITSTTFSTDIDGQSSTDNYTYDNTGNLISDLSEDITSVNWSLYGKMKDITRKAGTQKTNLDFLYDPFGNRVVKLAYNCDQPADKNKAFTFYARDAQGNIMATYSLKYFPDSGQYILLADGLSIYGSKRLGVLNTAIVTGKNSIAPSLGATAEFTAGEQKHYEPVMCIAGWTPPKLPFNPKLTTYRRTLGCKSYELTDHLGNVTVTITDRKIAARPTGSQTTVPYYFAEVKSTQDYYPFGQLIENRSSSAGKYRWGFNGKENDNEVKGTGNQQDYGMRIYDVRLCRFLTIDPKWREYPSWSSYLFGADDPIRMVEKFGEGPDDRVKAAKQFIDKGYSYSNQSDNQGRKYRTTFTEVALKKQDCIELVTRVLLADRAIKSMNIGKYDYYLAGKSTIGALLMDEKLFVYSDKPNVGDIAFWEGHVGIVSAVNSKDGTFKLIHASNPRNGILENSHFTTVQGYRSGKFYGFYHPLKETPDGKEIDITKEPEGGQQNVNLDQTPYVEVKKKENNSKSNK